MVGDLGFPARGYEVALFEGPRTYSQGVPVQLLRLASLLGSPADRAEAEHLADLVTKRAREDADLDFKRSNEYITGNDGADELAKDVSGMANARGGLIIIGHFLPAERPALFAGVHRALRPGGMFAFPAGAPAPVTSGWYWALVGFDLAMRVRNAVWRPPFVMYYRTCPLPAVRADLTATGFTVTTLP